MTGATDHRSAIVTGDFVGPAWDSSPILTPYAQAIADSYPVQVPWFLSFPITTLQDTGPLFPIIQATQTRPQQYDVLIIGANITANFNDWYTLLKLNNLSIQISHQETGIPWVEPVMVGFAPLLAVGGFSTTLPPGSAVMPTMNNMRLPDAFFLPRQTVLEFQWTQVTTLQLPPISIILTFIGIQLMKDGPPPEFVTLPNGSIIRVGSRIPWFGVVPYGRRFNPGRLFGDFVLTAGDQYMQFLPPSDCNVEVHDVYSNFTAAYTQSQNYAAKLSNMRAVNDWTPGLAPIMSIAGDELKKNPALPFCMPYVLERGHRFGIVEQNNSVVDTPVGCTLTFRGVRRCQY